MDPERPSTPPLMGPFSFPAGNDDFRAARDRCARACRAFNDTHEDAAPSERASRWLDIVRPVRNRDDDAAPVIHDMTFTKVKGPRKADIPFVKPPFYADYGLRLRVGGSTFINRFCTVLDTPVADITIGERCKIGPHLCIAAAGHALSPSERAATRSSLGKGVAIGDDVWIGANVTIL
ncbi:trimeric LpxA-like protein [Thozetella sp. PMI_491]|nr:trimeric LpxA-like protein [Thozetella sp. PMI_491]